MSFANQFKRAAKEIEQEIAYYRGFAPLDGMAEPQSVLEDLRDDWEQRRLRFEGRGRAPSEPDDWEEDQAARVAAKEQMDKIIKVAAAAEEAKRAQAKRAAAIEEDQGTPDEAQEAAGEAQDTVDEADG